MSAIIEYSWESVVENTPLSSVCWTKDKRHDKIITLGVRGFLRENRKAARREEKKVRKPLVARDS